MKVSNDGIYKNLFGNRLMVASLLRDFVNKDFVSGLDLDTLELCPTEHISDDLKPRFNDIIWKVQLQSKPCYLCLMLEFQSAPDAWMALRILVYSSLLWEHLVKSGNVSTGSPLPPIFPIVLSNAP